MLGARILPPDRVLVLPAHARFARKLGPCSRRGLFRRPDGSRDSRWVSFTTADGKFVRSVETTPMFQQWRDLVNARDLASAHQHVENFVGAQCLALYAQASEGGATASGKRRKLSAA